MTPSKILRNRVPKLILKLQTGKFSLQAMATEYGVSRERIRQIYVRETGEPFKVHNKYLGVLMVERRQKHLDSVAFFCVGCKATVLYREKTKARVEPRRTGAGRLFCKSCVDLMYKKERDPRKKRKCRVCEKPFFGFKNEVYQGLKGHFCSAVCYRKSPDFEKLYTSRIIPKSRRTSRHDWQRHYYHKRIGQIFPNCVKCVGEKYNA